MKITTVTSLIVVTAISIISTGCTGSESAYKVPGKKSLLGIIEYEEASFANTTPNTLSASTDELVPRNNFSGDKVKLFWGLVTINDF